MISNPQCFQNLARCPGSVAARTLGGYVLLGFNSLFIHRNHKLNKHQVRVACGQCIPGARVDIESTSALLYDHSDRTDY